MKSLSIGKKYNCEEEWWHMEDTNKSQKQKEQWKSYVSAKLAKGAWIEQTNEKGEIFMDKFLHPQCEFIRIIKQDEKTSKDKRKQQRN